MVYLALLDRQKHNVHKKANQAKTAGGGGAKRPTNADMPPRWPRPTQEREPVLER